MKKTLLVIIFFTFFQNVLAQPKIYLGMSIDELVREVGMPPHSGDGNLRDKRTALLKYCSTRNGVHTLVYFLGRDNKLISAKKTSNNDGGQCHDHFQYADFEATDRDGQIVLTDRLLPMTSTGRLSTLEIPKQQEKHWSQKFAEAASRFNQSMQKSYQNDNTQQILNDFRQRQKENFRNNANLYGDRKKMNCRQDGLFSGQIECTERSYRDPYLYLND